MRKYWSYIYIPLVKWLANLTVVVVVFSYILPSSMNKWLELGIGWAISCLIAMLFAYWAMHEVIPHGKDLAIMILIWAVITALMEMLISYYSFWDPFYTLLRYEFAVQLLVEVLGVLIMVKVLRRQHAYSHAAEGINLGN